MYIVLLQACWIFKVSVKKLSPINASENTSSKVKNKLIYLHEHEITNETSNDESDQRQTGRRFIHMTTSAG